MQTGLSSLVVKQLLNDAPYAWLRWDQASYSPLYRRPQFEQLEARLNAYIEAMMAHIHCGSDLLSRVKLSDWGAIHTVAYIALLTGDEHAFFQAVDAVKNEAQSRELRDALRKAPFETAKPFIHKIAHHDNPWIQVAAIHVVGHHFDEINPDWLLPHLNSEVAAVRVAALRVIGDKGLISYENHIKAHFAHEEISVRFQAAYSGNLLGIAEAYKALIPFFVTDNPYLRKALGLVHHLHDISAIKQAIPRIQNGNFSPRIKAYNLAMAGLPDWVPVLLEWMKDPEYAPLAGEAFCFITGADLNADDLLLRNPEICESHEAPLAQKRKRDPWTQAYEEDLPWPDPEAVAAWWEANRQRFHPDTRYLAGRTLTEANLRQVIEDGTQPQRHQADLILRLHHARAI